jgi:hypothetical protein
MFAQEPKRARHIRKNAIRRGETRSSAKDPRKVLDRVGLLCYKTADLCEKIGKLI